jgi:hypothetical protein
MKLLPLLKRTMMKICKGYSESMPGDFQEWWMRRSSVKSDNRSQGSMDETISCQVRSLELVDEADQGSSVKLDTGPRMSLPIHLDFHSVCP